MKHLSIFIFSSTITFSALSWGGSFTVTSNADAGAGSLRQAIIDLNLSSDPSNTITINPSLPVITLASDLPNIERSVSITASGPTPQVIDGNTSKFRLFSTLSSSGAPLSISIQNCTLQNGGAIGGSGGDGLNSTNPSGTTANRGAAGGGGMGAGGALFISPFSTVTLVSNVSLINNKAQGGKGGNVSDGPVPTSTVGGSGGGASFSDNKNAINPFGGGTLGGGVSPSNPETGGAAMPGF